MPITPVAKETIPSRSPEPDPAPSFPEMSTTAVPSKDSSPPQPVETVPEPTPTTAKSTVPVQREDAPNSQDAVRPKVPPAGSQTPVEDGEKAGPSELNCHPSSSSSSTPSACFIPFSGGGQRLGGPGGALSSSSSSFLSALGATVESPKAKKAKSSHGSNTKVSPSTRK